MAAIRCPRCSQPCTTRLRYLKGVAGGVGVGLVFVLMLPFLQPTYCPNHGKVPLAEFSESDRTRMKKRTVIQIVVTVGLLATAVGLIVAVGR
jgi:hypothetical protein